MDRHTLRNILETGNYTINQVAESFFKPAHQTSARYPEDVSEFDAVGLTPLTRDGLPAPFVSESPVTMHLSLVEKVDIETNGTVLVLGKVTDVFLDQPLLTDDGTIDLQNAGTITGSGLDGYHLPSQLARLSYAKVDRPVSEI
jgi:flavin reductase (DIM6/NTAB) family NADH-FMN oxidoreductase RutF